MALFTCQTLLAQEVEKVSAVSAEVNVEQYSNNSPDKIIDGIYSTRFEGMYTQVAGTTATVTLAEEVQLDNVKLFFGNNYNYYSPAKLKVQVSTDNATWTDVEGSEV
ncbi:MAG: discoidin domain-containing protein, partial [Paludibacteraceae bacterium]|nr:discoidin domain-containing protein [Paludibacteraceae bacterium]